MIKFTKVNIIAIVAAIVIITANYFLFFSQNVHLFYFLSGIALVLAGLPFIFELMTESEEQKENNEMFLEFSRNLVENVKSGIPISKSILILKDKNYGTLTPYIQKLANQISLGIPVKEALQVMARDTNSTVIRRAVSLISEAEKAGGEIEGILEAVSKSTGEIEKIKKERRAAVYSIVVQGYIIFFIFLVIMLIMQFKILPMTKDISSGSSSLSGLGGFGFGTGGEAATQEQISAPMLYLLIIQGVFTGLVIGKLAEGNFKEGIKHSFIMVAVALLIYTGARAFI